MSASFRCNNLTSHLVVVNYSMRKGNTIFSHQVDLVLELANQFEKVTVLSGEKPDSELPSNVTVTCYTWHRKKHFRNLVNFMYTFLKVSRFRRDFTLFSHMTESQSAIIAMIVRLLGIRHVLWYAHASNSLRLRWCHFWVNTIITSTNGSCPIKSRKIVPIGQGIKSGDFLSPKVKVRDRKKLVTFGRFDESKNLHLIIEVARQLRIRDNQVELTIIGSSSRPGDGYMSSVIAKSSRDVADGWLKFFPSVDRSMLPSVLSDFGIFVHCFDGSLDKSLIEATLLGIPIATTNTEYLQRYEPRMKRPTDMSLYSQILEIQNADEGELESSIIDAQNNAIQLDEFTTWSAKIGDILGNKKYA